MDGDPFFVQSAKGAYITDADGRQLIDYIGTWGPAILGHAPQPVLDAVHAAVDRGLGYGIPAPAEVDMAEMITDMVPSVEKSAWSTPERKQPCPPSGWLAAIPDAVKSLNSSAILEPFPANAGLYFPQNDFLHFLREITPATTPFSSLMKS